MFATCTCQACHDDGHVSRGQGRDDDDGGDRGEEDTEEGRGQGARAGDTPRLVSTFGIWNTLVYLLESLLIES